MFDRQVVADSGATLGVRLRNDARLLALIVIVGLPDFGTRMANKDDPTTHEEPYF